MLSYVNTEKKDCILFYGSRNIYTEEIFCVLRKQGKIIEKKI